MLLPKIVCFPSSHCVGANVIKNCDPLVSGPELAIDTTPAPIFKVLNKNKFFHKKMCVLND